MLRVYGPQSLRRLFLLFALIGLLTASLIYFVILPPQASESTNAQTRTGQLRLIDKNNREYFYLRQTTDGKIKDIIITGLTGEANLQLAQFVGKGELTVTGQTQAPARTSRRPGFGVRVDFYVATVTPPTTAAIPCDNSGSKLDVLYLIDASGTMDDLQSSRLNPKDEEDRPDRLVKQIAEATKGKLHQGDDRLGLVTFSNSSYQYELTDDLDIATQAVTNTRYGASGVNSNVAAGVEATGKKFNDTRALSRTVPGIVIILADNQTDVSSRAVTLAQDDFKNRNIRYFTISLGGGKDGLKQIAESSGGKYFVLDDHEKVTSTVNSLFAEIDKPFAQCISIELQSSKETIRKGGKATLTYKVINNSRQEIKNANIMQALPSNIFKSEDSTALLTRLSEITIGNLKPGESKIQEVKTLVAN
jgi:hypothetical protein